MNTPWGKVDRRRFLRLLGLGGAGLGLGTAGALWHIQPRRVRLAQRPNQGRPDKPPVQKRVHVIGGGLAGLSAALELQARGFSVHLFEQATELGGKLTGWNERALGEDFPLEHGFHGFFSQYYNLDSLLHDAGVRDVLEPADSYPVLFANRPAEHYRPTTKIFPANLLAVVAQSESLRLADFPTDGPGLFELMRYSEKRTFSLYDDIDFATFYREGRINQPMVDTVLVPFGRTTLNRLERLSAAEAIRFFHFYFLGNPEGLAFRVLRRDSLSGVLAPLRRRFEELGGTLSLGTRVNELVVDGGGVRGVLIGKGGGAAGVDIALADVPETGFAAVADGEVMIGRRGDEVVAFSSRCTHMGCKVSPLPSGGFLCPCHAGRYDAEGRILAGPPPRPLDPLSVTPKAGDATRLVIGGAGIKGELIPCDWCVVACEVRGLRGIVGASSLPAPDLVKRVARLGEADPYIVWRLWLDKPVLPSRQPFYTVSAYRYTDSLALYSQFQQPFIDWAKRTGGSVIETHAYAIAPEAMRSDSELRAALFEEMLACLPELNGAKILHDTYMRQDNFSRFAPGDAAHRPGTRTEIYNLLLAGDHVALPTPAFLMEAATLSGRIAANEILWAEGARELDLWTVSGEGPLG